MYVTVPPMQHVPPNTETNNTNMPNTAFSAYAENNNTNMPNTAPNTKTDLYKLLKKK